MSGSILSQDEIEALLHAGDVGSSYEILLETLAAAANQAIEAFNRSFGAQLEMEGPYIERLSEKLGQSITEDSFVRAANIGPTEVFILMSNSDAATLSTKFKISPQRAVEALSEAWAVQFAELMGLPYGLYQIQSVRPAYLTALPVEANSALIRHLFSLGREALEFCLFIQAGSAQGLVDHCLRRKPGLQPTGPSVKAGASGRRFLKGKKSPVTKAAFRPLDSGAQDVKTHHITLLDDIDLLVTVELGQVTLTLNEVLELKPQSVIELERHAGDPVDVYVNERLAAKGEVVVLEENFGVRILEIIPKSKSGREDRR